MRQVYLAYCLIFVSLASCSKIEDDLEAKLTKKLDADLYELRKEYDSRQLDLEARVAKLEQLIRIGTLHAEYSKYGLKTDGFYQIDPDGPLHCSWSSTFSRFCNFSTGLFKTNLMNL